MAAHMAETTGYVFLVTRIFWGRKEYRSGRRKIQISAWSELWLSFAQKAEGGDE